MNQLLNIENVTTGYKLAKGKTKLLHKNFSTNVSEGEFIALLGPNGAGKSTLLKSLLGFIPTLNGKIYYRQKELSQITVKELATKASVVLTDNIDDLYLTAEEVLWTSRYPYGSLTGNFTKNDEKIVEKAIEQTEISGLLHRKLHTLSDGERQRVMIARALAQDTPLLFLDEPTAFIDSPGRVELMRLLTSIHAKGKSILMTIHDVELALRFTEKLWLLRNDGIIETGKPGELIENGSINRLFDRNGIIFNKQSKTFY